MDFQNLYTRTDGRISRRTWWIGVVVLALANIAISWLVLPLIGLGGPNIAALIAAQSDPAKIGVLVTGGMQSAAWGSLILFLVFAYPGYCLSVKRRHDKNNNGMDVLIYFAAAAVLLLIQALGLGYTVADVGGIPIPSPTLLLSVVGAVVGIFGIYMLVVLGFLKGTDGTNDYGPDPLSGSSATA